MPAPRDQRRLALLIDADNASPDVIAGLLSEVSKYGVPTVKRIYGDWTTPNMNGWKPHLLDHSISPVQQFRYTSGKNATDSAMIIDAMDLLYSGNLDGFCLVSSDSDFTRLAARIRESGLVVLGFGERKTPTAFVSACDRFLFTDILSDADTPDAASAPRRRTTNELKGDTALVALVRKAIDACADEEGWANLGPVGGQILTQKPDFDSRHYGYAKLSALIEAMQLFTVKREPLVAGGHQYVFVRDARPKV